MEVYTVLVRWMVTRSGSQVFNVFLFNGSRSTNNNICIIECKNKIRKMAELSVVLS